MLAGLDTLSRYCEMMYAWFNKHLLGGSGEVKEVPFKPVPPKELAVFDADHPGQRTNSTPSNFARR